MPWGTSISPVLTEQIRQPGSLVIESDTCPPRPGGCISAARPGRIVGRGGTASGASQDAGVEKPVGHGPVSGEADQQYAVATCGPGLQAELSAQAALPERRELQRPL